MLRRMKEHHLPADERPRSPAQIGQFDECGPQLVVVTGQSRQSNRFPVDDRPVSGDQYRADRVARRR